MNSRQKTTAPKRKLTPEQTQKIESTIATFQQQWGMNLNAKDTQKVIERVTEHISEQDSEVKIRPPVRDQMFAMLIARNPEKAINLRMKMYEKRGKSFTDAQKTKIRAVAKTEGWRASRIALRAEVRGTKKKENTVKKKFVGVKKPQGGVKVAKKSKPQRKPSTKGVAVAPKTRGAKERDVQRHTATGFTLKEKIQSAISLNNEIVNKRKTCEDNITKLGEDYFPKFQAEYPEMAKILEDKKTYSLPEIRKAEKKFGKFLGGIPEYSKRVASEEKRFAKNIGSTKKKRDIAVEDAYDSYMRVKRRRNPSEAELKNLRNGLNTKIAAGFVDHSKRDNLYPEEARQNAEIVGRILSGMIARVPTKMKKTT